MIFRTAGKPFPWPRNGKTIPIKYPLILYCLVIMSLEEAVRFFQDNGYIIYFNVLISALRGTKSADTNSVLSFKLHCNSKCHPR